MVQVVLKYSNILTEHKHLIITSMDSKLQSILSYLGILWLVAYFMGKDQRDDFSRFHLKQGLGLIIFSFIFSIALGIIAAIVPAIGIFVNIASILILVLLVIGIMNAANGKMKPLPIIGDYFSNSFKFIDQN
ncbi:hypothetical protein GCM10022216_28100 [Sphingobacterium kyonggiense]|uniref:Import component protein n=2 Tax=Sphingobacterium kyonggiense TaxID=714075 RepID=A0ABP7Z0B5_9SPHI